MNAALGGWGLEPLRITGELRIPLAAEACIFYPLRDTGWSMAQGVSA